MAAPTIDRATLVREARERYDRYIALAAKATTTNSRWTARRAAVLAAEAADLLPDLIAALDGDWGGEAA